MTPRDKAIEAGKNLNKALIEAEYSFFDLGFTLDTLYIQNLQKSSGYNYNIIKFIHEELELPYSILSSFYDEMKRFPNEKEIQLLQYFDYESVIETIKKATN